MKAALWAMAGLSLLGLLAMVRMELNHQATRAELEHERQLRARGVRRDQRRREPGALVRTCRALGRHEGHTPDAERLGSCWRLAVTAAEGRVAALAKVVLLDAARGR